MTKGKEFFYCYSPNLYRFLKDNKQRYICRGLNERTLKPFWQYRQTEELSELLTMYTEEGQREASN
jgi:hypothetical protein